MSKRDFTRDFKPFENHVWLNCAHQGPLPKVAIDAAREALRWKILPYYLNEDAFIGIPQRLKETLGKLIGAPAGEIILGNSTSYGIHLLANGIPWQKGDEILLVKGDFPATILPWLGLEKKGVKIRFLEPEKQLPEPEELQKTMTKNTRLFCASWVNSFTGYAIDIRQLGEICQENNVLFIVNGSQALGARYLDISETPIDALTCCGFKWLCGPYGTGFIWIKPHLLDLLEYNQVYWLAQQQGRSLDHMREYTLRKDLGNAQYDVFCTANFLNFMPWTATINHLLEIGISVIEDYDNQLVSYFIEKLDLNRYQLISPKEGACRSSLILFTHRTRELNTPIYQRLEQEKINIALRENNLRLSPHLYNTTDDLDQALSILNTY